MRTERVLYLHSGRCTVYEWSKNRFIERIQFDDEESGPAQLRDYLEPDADRLTAILADIVEEEHYRDTVPKLRSIDQRAMLKRRIARSHSKTPYRNGAVLSDDTGDPNKVYIRLSGITRPEAIRRWSSELEKIGCPVIGVFTPAVMCENILRAVKRDGFEATLIATTHSDGRIRHSYFRGSCLVGSRRFRDRNDPRKNRADFIVGQIESSLRHFNPSATPGSEGQTDVVLVGGVSSGQESVELPQSAPGFQIRTLDMADAAKALSMRQAPASNQGEYLYIYQLRKPPATGDFAPSRERRYGLLNVSRSRLKAAVWVLAALSLSVASFNSYKIYRIEANTKSIQSAVVQLEAQSTDTDRAEFTVDPLTMRAAVTSYRRLIENTPQPLRLLSIVSQGLSTQPGISISGLKWAPVVQAEPEDPGADDSETASAPDHTVVSIAGTIEPFNGDYEYAFERVNAFVKSLDKQPGVVNVIPVSMPIDVNPQSSLEGEVSIRGRDMNAKFEVEVTIGRDDESV